MALDPNEFEQFLTSAKVKLIGASDAGVKAELYDVMKEFFTDSNCWMEDVPFLPIHDQVDYVLGLLGEGQIIRLIGAWDGNGTRVPCLMPVYGTLQLVHAPSNDSTTPWYARVCKTVTQPITSEGLPIAPDWTLRVHSVHIMDGLLGKMMSQQSKSYSNSTMAAYHLKRFRQGIKIARTDALWGNTVGAQAWNYPQIAPGSQRGGVSTGFPTRF
jgi:hypothetical protein